MSSIEIYESELNQYNNYLNGIGERDFLKEIEILSRYEHLREVYQNMFPQGSYLPDSSFEKEQGLPCLPSYDGLIIPLKLKKL